MIVVDSPGCIPEPPNVGSVPATAVRVSAACVLPQIQVIILMTYDPHVSFFICHLPTALLCCCRSSETQGTYIVRSASRNTYSRKVPRMLGAERYERRQTIFAYILCCVTMHPGFQRKLTPGICKLADAMYSNLQPKPKRGGAFFSFIKLQPPGAPLAHDGQKCRTSSRATSASCQGHTIHENCILLRTNHLSLYRARWSKRDEGKRCPQSSDGPDYSAGLPFSLSCNSRSEHHVLVFILPRFVSIILVENALL